MTKPFFITVLGSVCGILGENDLKDIIQFIKQNKIEKIYIVNNTRCTFIESALGVQDSAKTEADQYLSKLLKKSCNSNSVKDINEERVNLCKHSLLDSAHYLTDKLLTLHENMSIDLLIYDMKGQTFTAINDCY